MKKLLMTLSLVLLALLLVIQLVPVSRANPPVEQDMPAPAEVKKILRTSCYDCHSNETHWELPAYVAPFSWLIARDVIGHADLDSRSNPRGSMRSCSCSLMHHPRRVVLTGGPGAGKTALLEMARQSFCRHLHVLPEAASMLFGGGFPRQGSPAVLRAAQRAIFYTQRELEATTEGLDAAVVLCDRGTVDGVAYWPGPDDLWQAVGTTRSEQLARYDAVIHLRTPTLDSGYNHVNRLRTESAAEAQTIDERILAAWESHPRRTVIDPTADFFDKAALALSALRSEFPECCRGAMTDKKEVG